jgi:hypothetical protein
MWQKIRDLHAHAISRETAFLKVVADVTSKGFAKLFGERLFRVKAVAARLYTGRYQLEGDIRITEVPLKTTDKQVAQKLLDELVREKERERAGIIPPKKLRDSAVRQMQEHLADYLNNLRNIGRDDVYIENLGYRLNILIHQCGWGCIRRK